MIAAIAVVLVRMIAFCQIGRDAPSLHDPMIRIPVIVVTRVVFRVYDLKILPGSDGQAQLLAACIDHLGAANQNGCFCGFFQYRLCCAQNAFVFAFGKDNSARCDGCGLEHRTHEQGRFEDRLVQAFLIGFDIRDWPVGNAAGHGGLRNR